MKMTLPGLSAFISILVFICGNAIAAEYNDINPADKIKNPSGRIYNPSSDIKNPADKISNPAEKITTNPNPVTPAAQPVVMQAEPANPQAVKKATAVVQKKYYTFTKVNEYIVAAKKAFVRDDIIEFIAITEDALRRITAGSLKAAAKTKIKLNKYRAFGYSLLEE